MPSRDSCAAQGDADAAGLHRQARQARRWGDSAPNVASRARPGTATPKQFGPIIRMP